MKIVVWAWPQRLALSAPQVHNVTAEVYLTAPLDRQSGSALRSSQSVGTPSDAGNVSTPCSGLKHENAPAVRD